MGFDFLLRTVFGVILFLESVLFWVGFMFGVSCFGQVCVFNGVCSFVRLPSFPEVTCKAKKLLKAFQHLPEGAIKMVSFY